MTTTVRLTGSIVKTLGFSKLLVGKKDQVPRSTLSEDERAKLREFFALVDRYLSMRSPYLLTWFDRQKPGIEFFTEVVKARLNDEPFGGIDPDPGEFGITLAFPQLLKYDTSTPVGWENNSWEVDLTAGTAKWLFGDDTHYYRGNSATDKKTALLILEEGLYEVGHTPSIVQYKIEFEGKPYPPYAVNQAVDLPVKNENLVYPIDFPQAVFVPWDYGFRMKVMPSRSGKADIRILGVIWYEHDAFSDLVWLT